MGLHRACVRGLDTLQASVSRAAPILQRKRDTLIKGQLVPAVFGRGRAEPIRRHGEEDLAREENFAENVWKESADFYRNVLSTGV